MHRGGRDALLGVSLDVLGEVVGAHEPAVADAAAELLLAGVRALVARQLVGAREAALAASPRAPEGSLAGVRPRVRLQVRRLEVVLAAAGVRALVETSSSGRGGGHQPQGREQRAGHQHRRGRPRRQGHPARRRRRRGRRDGWHARLFPGRAHGVRRRNALLDAWDTNGRSYHRRRWTLSLRRNVLRVAVAAVHFKLESFQYVHFIGGRG